MFFSTGTCCLQLFAVLLMVKYWCKCVLAIVEYDDQYCVRSFLLSLSLLRTTYISTHQHTICAPPLWCWRKR